MKFYILYIVRNFIKNDLRDNLGQLIIVGDFSLEKDLSFNVTLNNFYPTLTYHKGGQKNLTTEDKDIPMNITVFKLADTCRNSSISSLNLLLLAKLASSGQMKTKDSHDWKTLEDEEMRLIERTLCGSGAPNITTHIYRAPEPPASSKIQFLVLENSNNCCEERDIHFLVANQRQHLMAHSLTALNSSLSVVVGVRCVDHSEEEVGDQHLMEWLYIK